MDYSFQRRRLNEIPEEKILAELEDVAKKFNYVEFSWRDFDSIAAISANTVKKRYGNWSSGLEALKKHLESKGLELSPRPYAPNRVHSDNDLFDEMEKVWKQVGQRPSRTEWEMVKPKIAYGTYKKRFGGWNNACEKFIEYKMGNDILSDDFVLPDRTQKKVKRQEYKPQNSRNISLSLRLAVLNRDNFRCLFCGRSPATDIGTKLHIDHIKPFSDGGTSTIDNLQTLCEECNLGKSDRVVINMVK